MTRLKRVPNGSSQYIAGLVVIILITGALAFFPGAGMDWTAARAEEASFEKALQSGGALPGLSGARQQDAPLALLLIVDISGSMERTDPNYLRETASQILIDLTRPGDYVGVIAFDSIAETVFPLQLAGGADHKHQLKRALEGRLDPRSATDFAAAFTEALAQLDDLASDRSDEPDPVQEVVVFLTDGDPNPDPARRDEPGFIDAYMETVWAQMETFDERDASVYSIGFGEVEQRDILERVAEETGGESYYLNDPAELAVTFFDIMGTLTRRTPLYRGTLGRVDEATQDEDSTQYDYEFYIDDFTRQVNLLAVARGESGNDEGKARVELTGPRSPVEDVTEITESGYTMFVIHNQVPLNGAEGDNNTGTWRVTLTGDQPVDLFIDGDTLVSAAITSPESGANYPVEEPLNLTVALEGVGELMALLKEGEAAENETERTAPRVEAIISKPGEARDTYIELQPVGKVTRGEAAEKAAEAPVEEPASESDGNHGEEAQEDENEGQPVQAETPAGEQDQDVTLYEAPLEGLNQRGEYQVRVRAYLGDQLIAEAASSFRLVTAPTVTADFRLAEAYQVGEAFTATAFLTMQGSRLTEGGNLTIQQFDLVLEPQDHLGILPDPFKGVETGEQSEADRRENGDQVLHYAFNDDGEDGDLRAGDGIWSTQVKLDEAGYYRAFLNLQGVYREEAFQINQDLGELVVAFPGYVEIIPGESPFWGLLGRSARVNFEVHSHSYFEAELDIITLEAPGGNDKWHLEESIVVDPGAIQQESVKIGIPGDQGQGVYDVSLQIGALGEQGIAIGAIASEGSAGDRLFNGGAGELSDWGSGSGLVFAEESLSAPAYQNLLHQEILNPNQLDIEVEVLSTPAFIQRSLWAFFTGRTPIALISVLALGVLTFSLAGGAVLYRKNVKPYRLVRGELKYQPEKLLGHRSDYSGQIDFNRLHKGEVVISIGKEIRRAGTGDTGKKDFQLVHLDEMESSYDLIVRPEVLGGSDTGLREPHGKTKSGVKRKAKRSDHGPIANRRSILGFIIEGWKSTRPDYLPPAIVLECTPPGIVKTGDGSFKTRVELYHGEVFMTGGYMFTYLNEERMNIDSKVRGKDILDKH